MKAAVLVAWTACAVLNAVAYQLAKSARAERIADDTPNFSGMVRFRHQDYTPKGRRIIWLSRGISWLIACPCGVLAIILNRPG